MLTRAVARKTLLAVVSVVLLPAALGAYPIPQNQCPGDCSPCLGPSDPFCPPTGTGTGDGPIVGYFCVICKQGQCVDAQVGERGKDESCTVVTDGMRVISCTTAGDACNGIAAVNP